MTSPKLHSAPLNPIMDSGHIKCPFSLGVFVLFAFLSRVISTRINHFTWINKRKEDHYSPWWPPPGWALIFVTAVSRNAHIQACQGHIKWGVGPAVEVWTAVCGRGQGSTHLQINGPVWGLKIQPFPSSTHSHTKTHTPQSDQWDAWRDTAIRAIFSLLFQHRRSWGQPLTHVSLCSLSVCCFFRWWWVQLYKYLYWNYTQLILWKSEPELLIKDV